MDIYSLVTVGELFHYIWIKDYVRRIARFVGCTVRTVYCILELFEETNDVIERNGRGRNMVLNDE